MALKYGTALRTQLHLKLSRSDPCGRSDSAQNNVHRRGVKTEASDARVTAEYVARHIEIGIEALRLIRRHGKSVRHLRFDE